MKKIALILNIIGKLFQTVFSCIIAPFKFIGSMIGRLFNKGNMNQSTYMDDDRMEALMP